MWATCKRSSCVRRRTFTKRAPRLRKLTGRAPRTVSVSCTTKARAASVNSGHDDAAEAVDHVATHSMSACARCSSCAPTSTAGQLRPGPLRRGALRGRCGRQSRRRRIPRLAARLDWRRRPSQQLALGTPPTETTGPIALEMSPLNLGSMYDIPNRLLVNHRVLGIDGYLKGSNLRSPLDISFAFASEQIDRLRPSRGRGSVRVPAQRPTSGGSPCSMRLRVPRNGNRAKLPRRSASSRVAASRSARTHRRMRRPSPRSR